MAVVQVRVMDVRMPHAAMAVPVAMRFGDRTVMVVVVVPVIVTVAVIVIERFVRMSVLMPLGQVQP